MWRGLGLRRGVVWRGVGVTYKIGVEGCWGYVEEWCGGGLGLRRGVVWRGVGVTERSGVEGYRGIERYKDGSFTLIK